MRAQGDGATMTAPGRPRCGRPQGVAVRGTEIICPTYASQPDILARYVTSGSTVS
jgi:hypothetical protein